MAFSFGCIFIYTFHNSHTYLRHNKSQKNFSALYTCVAFSVCWLFPSIEYQLGNALQFSSSNLISSERHAHTFYFFFARSFIKNWVFLVNWNTHSINIYKYHAHWCNNFFLANSNNENHVYTSTFYVYPPAVCLLMVMTENLKKKIDVVFPSK